MRSDGRIARIALLALCSVPMGLFLYYAGGAGAPALVPAFAAVSFLLMAFVSLVKRGLETAQRREAFRSGLMDALGSVLYYRSTGITSVSALEKASRSAEAPDLKEALLLLSRRRRLGEETDLSLDSVRGLREALPGNSRLANLEPVAIKGVLDSYRMELAERVSRMESESQRHATISMFVSTILPSFVVFAFIGSAIISGSEPSVLPFELAMLVALPMVYAVSYAGLKRRSIE